uniref:Chorismate-utilising enzyme C-terminal domain-containing protein n=1 Tax=Lotharella oceanica TaxID=641309 RepID=A0A7S2TZ06_9EUKA
MTGAPKRRSVELLETLEGGRRGIYSGCVGFFGNSGAVDLNVVIRTLIWTPEMLTLGTGGAIVYMSDAEEEHVEMLLKTRAIFEALSIYDRRTARDNRDKDNQTSRKGHEKKGTVEN